MNSTSNRPSGNADPRDERKARALVARIGALGDILLTRRLTYSLSRAGYRSSLLGPSRHASVLLADPWIDAVLDSESPRFAGAFAGSWPEESRFDAALLISNSEGLAAAARMAAREVIRMSPAAARDDMPIFQQWAEAARPFGAPFAGPLPRLETNPHQALEAGATLIHPGSGSPRKNWPTERFVELSRRLDALGHRVAWIRGPAEADFPGEISPDRVIDRPSLQALAATLGQAKLYIGNDSGVSHLAAAVGAPTVVIFGPTNAAVWRPDGPRVQALFADRGALKDIPVEAAIAAADEVARLSPIGRR